VFTFSILKAQSPGGVSTNLTLWLKANTQPTNLLYNASNQVCHRKETNMACLLERLTCVLVLQNQLSPSFYMLLNIKNLIGECLFVKIVFKKNEIAVL